MGFISRLLGRCATPLPVDPACWQEQDDTVTVALDRAPELAQPGGALRIEVPEVKPAKPTSAAQAEPRLQVLVVHGHDGAYHAYANHCPHGGRRLDPVPGQPLLRCCSLGRSTFTYDGEKVSGAAPCGLRPLPVDVRDNHLVVHGC